MSLRIGGLVHIYRALLRFWGLSLLNIFGLAIGFCAAMTIALYVRDELTFDNFIPDADQIFLLSSVYSPPGSPMVSNDKSPAGLARWLRTDSPAVAAVTRVHPGEWSVKSPQFFALEHFYWADANLFDVLPLKAVAGDLKTALNRPFKVVLTQKMARRYFNREDVVGEYLIINGGSPVEITAVLADFPPNTSLKREIFISGLSDYSMLSVLDKRPGWQWASSYTFLRLKPGAQLTQDIIRHIAATHWQGDSNFPAAFSLTALPDVHFKPEADSQLVVRSHKDTVLAMAAVSMAILLLAAANLAGLMTAQIDERRSEMAIRRSLGGRQSQLFLYILSEALIISLVSMAVGLALVERLLPLINAPMGLRLSLWAAPGFVISFMTGAIITVLLGALYPAYILSRPRIGPAGYRHENRAYVGRLGWIATQFTLLITLLISSQIVHSQWVFATGPALKFDASHLLQIVVYDPPSQLDFKHRIKALPGVADATLSRFIPEDRDVRPAWTISAEDRRIQFNRQSVDTNFFDMFKVSLLAGRNFNSVYMADVPPTEVILNRTAAKVLGYHSPPDAIGHKLSYDADNLHSQSTVIGVVEDMRINTVRKALQPMVFDSQGNSFTRLNVRLKPGNQTAVLTQIDQAWQQAYPNANPIYRFFYSDYLFGLYQDMIQQWWAFGLLSVVGICLSMLGLSGLSIYLTRVRSREIAIRNALGARLPDIIRMRLQPFVKPLLVANLAACLLSWLLMSWWLSSFDDHVAMTPMAFISAIGLTDFITLMTLIIHITLTWPNRPSQALRAF
ncbi:MAG: ABC transporter permease [Asticcacaulis sp.]